MDFCADSMADSMAGNASSPLTSGSILFPGVSGRVVTQATTRASIFRCPAPSGSGSPRSSGTGRVKVPCTPSATARRRRRLTPNAR